MKIKIIFLLLFCVSFSYSQKSSEEVFKRISTEATHFVVDTSDVPQDKLTKKIEKLLETKGGFNIQEALQFKIAEDVTKKDITSEEAQKREQFFATGKGKKWLNNAIIWMYRNQFSISEINKLTKFYKSPIGKKMTEKFPIIMIESMKSAEKIMEIYKLKNQE